MARIPLPPSLEATPFTIARGLASGLSEDRLRGRDLHRPFHGVRTSAPPSTLAGRCLAYQQVMPTHAFFCGPTSAQLRGVPLPPRLSNDPVLHVGVPAPHRAPRATGVHGHRLTVRPEQMHTLGGIRLSSPELLWCELGTVLNLAELVAAGDSLVHWRRPHTSIGRLTDAVAQHPGRRGKPMLREACTLLSDRAESAPESMLRVLLVQNGFDVAVNVPITTKQGFRYRGDLVLTAHRIIIEYQGAHHAEHGQVMADMTRKSRLQADGWIVIEVNKYDVRDPAELLGRIRLTIAQHRVSR